MLVLVLCFFCALVQAGLILAWSPRTWLEAHSPRIVVEDGFKRLFEQWALDNDGVNFEFLYSVVAFYITDQESVAGGLVVLGWLLEILGQFLDPRPLAVIIFLARVEVLGLRQHTVGHPGMWIHFLFLLLLLF